MAYSKYGLSFKNFTDSYGEWEANGGVEQANKAIDFKNLQNNSFNVRGLPGGTFGQSVIDSALGVAGNIDDFLGGPTGLGDYANNYVTAQEMAMGEKPRFDFSWDYFMNGLPRGAGNLIGSMVGLGVPVGAAVIAAPHLGISSGVAATGGALLGAGLEAGAEGGSKLRESLERGETLDDSQGKALEVFFKNAGLLGTTNLLGVSALRKAAEGVKKAFNAGRASSTGAIVSTPSRALEFAKGASLLEANALTESVQEAVQQGIQDSVEPDKEYGVLPWNWNEEQKESFYDTLAPMLLVGGAGGATRVGARKAGEWFSPDKLEQGEIDITANQDVSIPAQANYTIADEVSDANLSQGTESKLRMLDEAYYKQYGQHLYVTSMTRHWGTNSDHETGSAFDVADDGLANDAERRQWIAEKARQLGFNPLDEYENPSSGATGGHMHFSDKGGAVNVDTSGWSGNADIDSLIADTANRYGIDPNLLAAIAEQESGFNQSAQSKAGALGIMQLMPDTANGLGVDANDLAGNIEGGAKYIKQMLDQFGGDVHKALEAYNGGPGGVGNAETMKYADEVMQRYEKFKTKSAGTFSWSNPAETQADSTDYMKIMSDNNVTADTAGDFLQYVRLLAEDDANANNEQVQKDGAKAVKAIADGSLDVMERVAKELGYGQVKQEVEQEAPNIPMPKIRQHVQKNGWVEFRSKENADEFARTDYGKTLERVSNTRFVSPDFNAITGRVEPRTAQPQQVAQPAPQPTVQNKVQSDVASTNGQNIANNAATNNTTVGNLLSSIPNSAISLAKTLSQNPAAVSYNGNNVDLNKLNNAIKNNDIKTINGFNAHMMNNMRKNNVSLDDVVKEYLPVAKDTAMRLSKIPEAIAGAAGNRVDLRGLQEAINNNDLSRINAISEKMAENLRSNGVSPYLAMRDTESVEEAPTGSILPAVQGNRAPSTDVQDLGWRVEGEVESPITPPAPYTEAQLEAPAIESERDTLTSQEFLGKLNSVERQFMEYLDSVFDNTGVAFVDIMQHLNSQRNSLLGKAIEMFKNGYAVDSVVFSRMNDTQRSALVNYRRMLDVYGNSLTNADRDVIDEFTRLDNIINEYLAPMAHNYLINNNVLNYRGIDNAIKGLEGIAAKAREYEQIKVSEGYREGRATGNKVVPREDEEAISGSATAWGNVLHQTQKRGLPAETEGTKVQRFIKTLPNKIVQKSHSNSLNAMTNYAGEKITKAERVERVIKNGDSIQKIENEYFIVAPSGNIKVTKSEYNYYNYLLNERKNDKSNNGSKEYTSTSHETAYEGRKALAESNYKRGDVSVPENASNDEIGDLDIKTDDLKEVSDSNVREKTKSTVITDDGKEFNVVYKVMSADDVVASNLPTDGLPVNSKYPSAMQPRNRQRAAMQEQITSMSNNLRPADLTESRNLNQGAPVIKSDGAVLNGNGRTIAIQRAWLNGKADKYKQYLLDNAEKLGINPADIEGTEHPILVRVVQDKLSKDDIMSMINSTTGGQRMSPSEQAKVDSGKIKSSTLNQYVAGSDLTSAANRNFLRDVLADIISPSERNAYYSKEGAINQDGVLRAQRALFALAYGDDTLLDAFSEAVNEEAKNFSNALKANAPLIARLQQLIKTGNATDLGLQKNLVSAVKALKEAVIAGKPAKSIWQEMSMFEDTEHSPETIAIARAMDSYRRSGKKLTQFVRNLAELGLKHGNPNQSGLFGEDEVSQIKLTDDIATAKEYVDTGKQMDLFAPKYSRDKNVDNKGNVEDNKSKEKTPRAIDDYSALEKEEKSIVDKAVQERANALFNRIVSYVQSGFDDNFSEADSKLSKNALLQDGRRNNVLEHLLQYANRYAEKPSNYKDVLNNLIPGFKTAGKSKEELVKAYNLYRDVAREMLNYGQYVYSELCERLAGRTGQSYRASTWTDIDRSASESRQFDRTEDATKAIVELLRGQETIRFNTEHSEKNSRSAFSFANPDTAEELKSTGNIDTPLDRLPKLPASKLRDSERKMQAFGKAIGVPVHFVNHPDKGYRGVFTHNGEVYINRNATVPAKAIFLHEFTHWLKASGKENRAVFDALAACVERDSGLFHERRLKQYRDRIFGGEQMTDEEIIEEIICDAMGNSKTAERISKAIDNFAPELNQSIWGRIKAMWDKFCQMIGFKQEFSSKKQSLPNGLSQQEMAKFNAQLNILMSKMRTADGKPMFKVENYQLVVAENGKRPAEIFDINNINDYTPTYNIPAMPSSYSYQVHAQREAVRQQYEGTKEWMKAPNGEPTNLTEEQWLDVRTPNFKAWFGDWENNPDEASKVVDENGEPLVVYHGSESNFDEFDTAKARANMDIQGMFFSPIQEEANDYGENVRAFFLNIKNPADYDTGYNALKNHKGENLAGEKARNDLMENGYDGVNNDGEEYIAFNPNQIKSATENTGAFSPDTNNIKYSRDKAGITASTNNVGIFKRAMTALENKLKGKMPDNLDVRTYEDIEADRENARRAKAISRGKEYLDRSKEVSPFEMWWTSPSRLAKKIPLVSPFVQMAKIAVDKQEKLRVKFNSGMNEIEDLLGYSKWGLNDKRYKERKMALQEALLQGDINRKVFTDNELKSGGLDEQTIKAYHKMRELLDKAYTMADQTYSRTKYVSRNWPTAAEADGFMNDLMKKNPFVQIIQKKQNADGTVTYTYKEPHQYTVSALTVTEAELDELKKNKDVIITSEKHIYGDMFGNSTYRVTYHQKKANLGKIQGYIPHIFHGWLVCEVDKNGNIIKDSAGNIVVATSKNSMSEAVKEGKKIASQNTGKRYMVMPKLGKFSDGAAERAAIMGDFDYSKTMSKVANGMKMSIADAERFMKDTVSVQNRGRFLAYAQHRKGVQGYEQNVFLATQMYFNQIARYVALDPFKRDAISTYNRLFGSFTDNAVIKRSRNAKYIYEYINDMNGVPNGVEMWMNDMLHNMGLGQEVANGRPGLWLEHMFTYPFTIAKLGILNMSSALLNLTQLFNLYGAMGEKVLSGAGYERLLKKGFVDARKAITNKNSQLGQLVWKDLGLEAQIGIDVTGGYSRTEVNGLASLTGRLSKLAGGSMYLFRLSDTYTRAVTLLTAYNKALDEGMTKQEAIEYAKEINDKVNFDYSVADSPAIFRAFGPLSKVLLQFKKYPVKQIELFMDIFNDGRAAGLNRKQSALRLMKYTAPYMAFSGMMGIPFISLAGGILSAIMSAATGDDDWDWQQKIKQYMVETFGADNPLTMWWLYGAGSFIGINVGSRVGVGDFMGIENREKSPIDSILGMTTATSTVAQTTKQLGYGNYAEAVKAISPSAGNILIGLKGEVHTTRGRMKYQYQNAYEQALRMIGFNPLNETMAGDIASNDYANKQAEKRAKDDAIDAFIEEPTAENAAKLNELGVTPKSIQTEMARRKMNRAELNKIAEEEKAAKAKKSKQKKKQYSVNDYLKGK